MNSTQTYEPGSKIDDRYKIISPLGEGGMGAVYLVEDEKLAHKMLALKLLSLDVSKNATLIQRFKNEANITQEFKHESVVTTHHYGETERGEYYFTMDYVKGKSLSDLIYSDNRKEVLPFEKVVRYLHRIAEALNYAHKKSIVHRDLKPDNILITEKDEIKLTDFGIARDLNDDKKLTRTNEMVGTIYYMTPEQIRGDKFDHRADIYALGILAFEMVNGKVPFGYDSYHQLCVAHLTEEIPKFAMKGSGIPVWFQEFVEKCTAKDVNKRYQSMQDVTQALEDNFIVRKQHPFVFANVRRFWEAVPVKFRTLLICWVVGMFHLFLAYPLPNVPYSGHLGAILDPKIMDIWFQVRGRIEPPKDFIIISIDEKSHEKLGVSQLAPWPRTLMAELLETLAQYEPKKIILDYKFPALTDPQTDERLARAMKATPTFIAKFLKLEQSVDFDGNYKDTSTWLGSEKIFEENAHGAFFANLILHSGVVRRFNFYPEMANTVPSAAEIVFDDHVSSHEVPTRRDFINFYGPSGSLKRVPFHEVVDRTNPIPKEVFKEKFVLVGQQLFVNYDAKQTDTFLTPYQRETAGIEIHATSAANIYDGTWIRTVPYYEELLATICFTMLLAYFFFTLTPARGVLLLAVTMVLWLVTSYLSFLNYLSLPGFTLVICTLPILYFGSLIRFYWRHQKLKMGLGLKVNR